MFATRYAPNKLRIRNVAAVGRIEICVWRKRSANAFDTCSLSLAAGAVKTKGRQLV